MSDGNYVYIESDISNYNGFWYVDVIDSTTFKIKPSATEALVRYVGNTYITYYIDPTILTSSWNCVHLPILYKFSTNLWPTNQVDTVRTVSSFSDDSGYTNLNLSGSLGTFEELQFVKIYGTSDLDGVYQILDKYSTSDVTIALTYLSTNELVGGSVQLYYSDYSVVINVYAGLNEEHECEYQKQYRLISTLNLKPDENNELTFSINKLLQSDINISNNTQLATLPNNIDAFTQFYIEYGESYTLSNAYSLYTYETAMTSDKASFQGFAMNSILPFKNINAGVMSDYTLQDEYGKFLTDFTIPVYFSSQPYQDISFIYPSIDPLFIKKEMYSDDVLISTDEEDIDTLDEGVYRVQLQNIPNTYDYFMLSVWKNTYTGEVQISEKLRIDIK